MQRLIDEFINQIDRCNKLSQIYDELSVLNKGFDLSDLLRAQIVYSVSALDRLLHQLIKQGMIEIFNNKRVITSKYETFTISLKSLSNIQKVLSMETLPSRQEDTAAYWIEMEILQKHKVLSFQEPDKISDGLSLIWQEAHKWQKIFEKLDKKIGSINFQKENDMKNYLKNIIIRRNQIVHEGDIFVNDMREIKKEEVSEIVEFINKLGTIIYECVK